LASKPLVYNLSWLSALPRERLQPAPVARHNKTTLSAQKPVKAVILYPALATPQILVGEEDKLELLLLTEQNHSADRMRMHIRERLKISEGIDPAKGCADRALFVDLAGREVGTAAERVIDIEPLPFEAGKRIDSLSGRFYGYVDKRAFDLFEGEGYKTLYRVALSSKCLKAAMGGSELSTCGEPQDVLIGKLLDRRNEWAREKGKYYCWGSAHGDLDLTRFDRSNPIQSYHPVYHYDRDGLKYANFGHVSDVHLSGRQQVLGKTRARVIDYAEAGNETDLGQSPEIGSRVNVCSRDLIQILGKIADSSADMLLVGGDLVDFLRNCFLSAAQAKSIGEGHPAKVWQAVALADGYGARYLDCADLIAFFGILLDFCRRSGKPAFAVSGNHDCYHMPFGISPRVITDVGDKRLNEGIPADHNLTFYEAILAFGETYYKLTSGLSSPFNPEMFDWFYTVVTPFRDFAVELPRQHLVALSWGETEDLLDTPGTGHGFGHLPRAEGVSGDQLGLVTTAIGRKKKVIVLSHFTFVSYADSIPISKGDSDLGDVYVGPLKSFDDHNLGTFNRNRNVLLETHCGTNRDIQVVLTGHSHRRALYLVDSVSYSGRNSLKIRHFDFSDFADARRRHGGIMEPAIVVSDSGGSIPRYNLDGEFEGWGSDSPSGTTVEFNQDDGSLSGIQAQRADACRPRLAVALDYLDIQEKKPVFEVFASAPFRIADQKTHKLKSITFGIELDASLSSRGLAVESLSLYLKQEVAGQWRRIVLSPRGRQPSRKSMQLFNIEGAAGVDLFNDEFAVHRSRGAFLALKFAAVPGLPRYNVDDPWCWEFQVEAVTSGFGGLLGLSPTHKSYKILRHRKRAELPDFEWRRKYVAAKYA
jgi:hypothetical protein